VPSGLFHARKRLEGIGTTAILGEISASNRPTARAERRIAKVNSGSSSDRPRLFQATITRRTSAEYQAEDQTGKDGPPSAGTKRGASASRRDGIPNNCNRQSLHSGPAK
jgi:hypothetical protein